MDPKPFPSGRLPRISLVTVSYNAADYIDATLSSVLSQRYPDLEYILLDGGSRDGTMDIVARHRAGLSHVSSEPDGGQYHAIQRGLDMATGEVCAWLNADDIYLPWALSVVGEIFATFPEVDWIIGSPAYLNRLGQCTRVSGVTAPAYPRREIAAGWYRESMSGFLQQESMFWRRSLWQRVGGMDLSLKYAADFDLWRRFAEHADLVSVAVPLAAFRQRPGEQRSSAGRDHYDAEVTRVIAGQPAPALPWRLMGEAGEAPRHLMRMLRWGRAPVIAYSQAQQAWCKRVCRRPVARTSLADVLLERALRRAG